MIRIGTLPDKLCRIIFKAGRRKVVLVEGEDDVITFDSWFENIRSKILFYECIGKTKVSDWLDEIIADGRYNNVYGLRDRDMDYPDDELLAECYDERCRDTKLFILMKRNLENYLIDSSLIFGFFKAYDRKRFLMKNDAEVEGTLIKIGKELKYVTAANMVIHYHNQALPDGTKKPTEFTYGNNLNNTHKREIVRTTAEKLGLPMAEIKRRITPVLNRIELIENDLDELNKIVDGKRFLFVVRNKFNFSPSYNQLYNLLCDRIAQTKQIPHDIRFIIEERILS
jgi:hypothetical protein